MNRKSVVLGLWFAISALLGAPAQSPQTAVLPPVSDLAGFVDGMMEAQRKAHHVAGSVVVIVSEGQVVFQKGYGYADFAERKPVDPERTLFRIASNSKMFVWTAVMQLVEEGKLDLRADVNHYLKTLQVPATFPQPITLEQLMSHTAGFEDHVIGLFSESPETMRPLEELMRTQMPQRVFPPGQVPAYSNYGTALAALIVEQVSGIPYPRYLEERILGPLGMRHATLTQPLPEALAADMSGGYRWESGRLKVQPFELVPWGPCGGMSVSGADMGRFMLAHLNDGALGEARILKPETARLMRTRLASPYGMTAGMLHGFFPLDYNGEKIFGHGGDTRWFHSLTAMLPERHLGVFIAYNTDSGAKARSEFSPVFFDRWFPRPLEKEPPAQRDKRSSLVRFAGTYYPARSSFTDAARIAVLVGAVTLYTDSEGYLVSSSDAETVRWRQIEPLQFQEVDGKRRLIFRENAQGRIMDYCSSPLCVGTMQKQPRLESPPVQYLVIGASLVLILVGLVGIPSAALVQRKRVQPALSRLARLTAWGTCLVWAAGFMEFGIGMQDPQRIVFGLTPGLALALNLWVAAAILTIPLAAFTLLAWQRRWWHTAGRIGLTLILLGAVGCALWLNHWNLLGWKS
jgi:CubicO group peptidase (beta-lactamase class C family)